MGSDSYLATGMAGLDWSVAASGIWAMNESKTGPRLRRRTETEGSSLRREARTHPAVPAACSVRDKTQRGEAANLRRRCSHRFWTPGAFGRCRASQLPRRKRLGLVFGKDSCPVGDVGEIHLCGCKPLPRWPSTAFRLPDSNLRFP